MTQVLHLDKIHLKKFEELKPKAVGAQTVDNNHNVTWSEGIAKDFTKEFQKTHIEDVMKLTGAELGRTGYAVKDDGDKLIHLFKGASGNIHMLYINK